MGVQVLPAAVGVVGTGLTALSKGKRLNFTTVNSGTVLSVSRVSIEFPRG